MSPLFAAGNNKSLYFQLDDPKIVEPFIALRVSFLIPRSCRPHPHLKSFPDSLSSPKHPIVDR